MTQLTVTYRKSSIGYDKQQKATLAALGLRRLNQSVEHTLTPPIRGMVERVRHLVNVNGVPADSAEGMAHLRRTDAEATSPVVVAMDGGKTPESGGEA